MNKHVHIFVSVIFDEEPEQWGLRGDPYLWRDMKQSFSTISFPISENEFIEIFKAFFINFTGIPLTKDCHIFLSQYSHGGMSSGQICGEFWHNRALPLLLDRLKNYTDSYSH